MNLENWFVEIMKIFRFWCLIRLMEEPVYTMLLIMAIFLALKLFFLLLNLVMWLLLGLSFFFFRIILFSWIDFDFDAMLLWFFKCSWIGCRGFVRFVNVRDGKGATPLHLASRQRRPECVHILLDSGALVCASTGRYGYWSLNILWLVTWFLCILFVLWTNELLFAATLEVLHFI